MESPISCPRQLPSRLRLIVALTSSTVLCLALVGHFSATILYLTPMNPIKAQSGALLYSYVEPVFSQNWHLFAPTPVSSNFALMINCRGGASPEETGWVDITHALIARLHRNRVSPMSRIVRMHSGAMQSFLSGDTSLDEILARQLCARQPDHPVCARSEERSVIIRREAHALLLRIGAAACHDVARPNAYPREVNIRIAEHRFPRFSRRHLANRDGTVGYVDLGWHSAPRSGSIYR